MLLSHAVEGSLPLAVGDRQRADRGRAGCWPGSRRRPAHVARPSTTSTCATRVLIGCAQALALVPGVSRSGITLLAAMALGIRRDAAARFSFLLSVPAVAAAGVFELPKVHEGARHRRQRRWPSASSSPPSSGYASIAWLLKFLRTRSTHALRRLPRRPGHRDHRHAGLRPPRLAGASTADGRYGRAATTTAFTTRRSRPRPRPTPPAGPSPRSAGRGLG